MVFTGELGGSGGMVRRSVERQRESDVVVGDIVLDHLGNDINIDTVEQRVVLRDLCHSIGTPTAHEPIQTAHALYFTCTAWCGPMRW